MRKGAPPDGPVHRKSGSQVAVPGAPDHAGGHHRHHGLVPVGPVGTVRLSVYGYSPGVCGRISAHHLVVGAGLPGGVLAVQPVQQHLAVCQRGCADADHTGLCASGRAELCMRGAVWGAYAPVLLCVGPVLQLLLHLRHPLFLSRDAVPAQPGASGPEGRGKRHDHRRRPGRAAADPGIRRQQSSQQPGGLHHRRQPRQAGPHSGGCARCGCAAGHSPGRQAIRYRQDRVRHSVASGRRKAGDPQYMQHHRLPDPGGAGHVSAGQR